MIMYSYSKRLAPSKTIAFELVPLLSTSSAAHYAVMFWNKLEINGNIQKLISMIVYTDNERL